MPDDQNLSQFPSPPQKEAPQSPDLTDPVAPDISASPSPEPEIEVEEEKPTTPPIDEPEIKTETQPQPEKKVSPSPSKELKPASLPKSPPKTFFFIIFLLLIIAGLSAAFFFRTQNDQLKDQISDANQEEQQQQIEDRGSLPSPEPSVSPSTEEDQSPAVPTIAVTTSQPSLNPTTPLSKTFSIFTPLFEMATSKYPDAQLLLISATDLQKNNPVIKYYFRQQPDKVKYFYILNHPDNGLTLFDQQVWVSPDDNIPSLNQRAQTDQLGTDLDQVIQTTNSLCQEKHSDCNQATTIKAQFIDSNVTLWQVSYYLPQTTSPLVYQINSLTQELIFRSDK